MLQPADWVPLRWPSGPAAIAALKKNTAEDDAALKAWHRPESLSFVSQSPFNCIVVTWATGGAQDAEQQSSLKGLIAQAKKQGLAVVGSVAGDSATAADAARAAGLDAVLSEKSAGSTFSIPLKNASEAAAGASPVIAISDSSWPQIPIRKSGSDPSAGPTGMPWIDSNGWLVQLARAKAPKRTIWVSAVPPDDRALSDAAFAIAVADAEAYGARWIVSLPSTVRRGLASGDPTAMRTWTTVTGTLTFFREHRAWNAYATVARLGVVSDFADENQFMAQEVLNLAARRPLPYRVVERTALTATSIAGLKAVLWADAEAPGAAAAKLLASFVHNGGLLIAPPAASKLAAGAKRVGAHDDRFDVYAAGKGRIAISPKPYADPYVLAADAHLLMSRKHDVMRAWNGGSSNFNYVATADGRSAVVHIVNYTGRPSGGDMSLYVARPFTSATLRRVDGHPATRLKVTPKNEGVEVYLPPFSAYAAVEYGA